MRLAIFDLDNTLLAGDSDHLWGQYLVRHGVVDPEVYARENDRFYREYQAGTLDIHEYAAFSLQPLVRHGVEGLLALRARFVAEEIAPIVAPGTPALLEKHRAQGDRLLITTATGRFVTEPIAELLGVETLIATDPEIIEGRYTGRIAGTPNFQAGKVHKLRDWLGATGTGDWERTFYSDSRNDLPLLEQAHRAVAVDPDEVLRAEALRRGWPIISLREPPTDAA
ncbi:MAG TPA: HAD family hydrolase [Solimonas sp.]|nr:HAD family hydrolase [Solimonas sp.]